MPSIQADVTSSQPAPASDRATPTFARRVLLEALFLGGLADALLRDGFGLGLTVWIAVFAVMLGHLARSRGERLTREQAAWLTGAFVFAAAFAWRDSSDLRAYDFLAMLGALAFLGASLARGTLTRSILGQRLRDLAQSVGATIKQVMGGVLSLALVDSAPGTLLGSWRGGRAGALIRATVLTLPLLLVFGLLFGSADPLFEKLLSLPAPDWDTIASHVVLTGFFTWVVGGWLRGALVVTRRSAPLSDTTPFTLGTVEVTAVLGGLVALFALFVGVQVGWLFGGERLIRSRTGLGYAQYARHGFFELVWVSLLVLPVILGVRATIARDDERAVRRHRQLSLALLVLLGGVMASALGRMALYVHYYGLSVDRLFASVFMGWLALVFVWLGITVLRGRARDFAAGMIITGFLTLATVNVVNPVGLVAKVNVARAREAASVADSVAEGRAKADVASPIDYSYLTNRLDGDAVGVVVKALLAPPVVPAGAPAHDAEVRARCFAVRDLLQTWDAPSESDRHRARAGWRTWNAGAWRARRTVQAHESALRNVTCRDDSGEVPFGDRESRSARPGEQWYEPPASSGLSEGNRTP